MLRLVSDEDVHGRILRGLQRREPGLDLVRVQDVGLAHTPDPDILQWAATEDRVVVTDDEKTMVPSAWDRVRAGQPMPGVIVVTENITIRQAIEDIHLIADCYSPNEIRDQAIYIPL